MTLKPTVIYSSGGQAKDRRLQNANLRQSEPVWVAGRAADMRLFDPNALGSTGDESTEEPYSGFSYRSTLRTSCLYGLELYKHPESRSWSALRQGCSCVT
ncbi:hypothetical protein Bbelb_032980 [Branchiostoma belcheri]|nr:hypothetical protein Bbelb_032980 [Branchiostoma belcheri]